MMRQTSALPKGDKSAFGVFVDPSTPPTRPESKLVKVRDRQPLQPGRARNTASTGCGILQEVNNVNKKFSLSPNSLIGAEKENFDPVRKELAVYRRTMSKAKPLEDKVVVECSKDVLPSADHRSCGEHVDDSVGSSSGAVVLSTPTNRILANRGSRPATGNVVADTSPTSKAQPRCTADSEIRMPASVRPGRSMSVAVVPDRMPQRPLPTRKPSSGAAGRAGVGDLVQLLDSMGMVPASSIAASRLAQLQGMRRPQQHTEMPVKGAELRLSVPPPAARKLSTSAATQVNPPQDLRSNRTALPPPPKKPGNKQSKILSSALLTPPELRKSVR
ncbi:hypothetical protein H4S04_000654 [Coemansia sp. S16]|nr:hypothetical protein H4S03_002010 [Coemansia sp. S3946]KAJ2046312.1 hypothetical protein GGI08_006566 [Coemansia sp. S2]KAJ2053466.1 hypothetical protein H4S04_000654 [Coemansia sp. S16]